MIMMIKKLKKIKNKEEIKEKNDSLNNENNI